MIGSFIVFTADHCPGCKPVKEFLQGKKIPGKVLDIEEAEGGQEAVKFSVRSLPTVIFLDKDNNEVGRAHNIIELRSALGSS